MVLAKHTQCDMSTMRIAFKEEREAIESGRRIDPELSVPAPAGQQEEGRHRNTRNRGSLRQVLGENVADSKGWPRSKRRQGVRGLPPR